MQLSLSAGRGIGTWDWDVPGDRVVADERFARLYGVDPEKAKRGASVTEFAPRPVFIFPDTPWKKQPGPFLQTVVERSRGAKVVLVVDDEPSVRMLCVRWCMKVVILPSRRAMAPVACALWSALPASTCSSRMSDCRKG